MNSADKISNRNIDVEILLSVDDKTRHWFYLRNRTDEERAKSLHKVQMNGGAVGVQQRILDGRANQEFLKLDDASFELVDGFDCSDKFSNKDFYDMQSELKFDDYHKAVEDFVKAKLGCDKVKCFHSQVRNAEKASSSGVEGYAGGSPHTDSSPVSADETALQMLEVDGDTTNYHRYCYLNLWKNISDEPIENDHLAMMDERTAVKPDDYIPKDLFGPGYDVVQYGLNARHAHLHKWYYFPQMTNTEAILFKQMDSDPTKTGRICFHMSVHDQSVDKNGEKQFKPRESVETRMFCYWKNDTEVSGGKTTTGSTMPTAANTNQNLIKNPEIFAMELAAGMTATTSVWKLLLALVSKIPLLSWLLSIEQPPSPTLTYSGNPEDYLARFVSALKLFDVWPAAGKLYVKNMFQNAKDYDTGLLEITKLLVDDSTGYNNTKSFTWMEKKAIITCLLSHEPYLEQVKQHLGC